MYLHIFKTLLNRIEQSYEAEINFFVLQLRRRSILQGFTFITHIFLKFIEGQGHLEGEGVEVVASKYLPGTYGTYLPGIFSVGVKFSAENSPMRIHR